MANIEHKITIETRIRRVDDSVQPNRVHSRPTCSCGNYSAAWGWTREGAESRGRAHVQRAAGRDARRSSIIAQAAGAPVVKRGSGGDRAGGRS
jgi:hypothetical protein